MAAPIPSRSPLSPPSLDDLTARYLAAATDNPTSEPPGEVELHEVASGFRPAARALWDEVFVPLRQFGVTPDKLTMPPDWSAFVQEIGFTAGLPMAAGLCPQQDWSHGGTPGLRVNRQPVERNGSERLAALRNWVRKATRSHSATTLLAAAGIAAVLGEEAEAQAALSAAEALVRGPWKLALENQRASVLWLSGRHEEAANLWEQMPESPVVTFNRGLASLMRQQFERAQTRFQEAGSALPDSSGWSHLAWLQADATSVTS